MGEVYRATDTKLKRPVAVKILPWSLAADTDRLARFQREAEVLASLNHPNIAAIYGLEAIDGGQALVMELVEGEDLAQRIARGPIPLDEALPIAKQIAEALEAAHDAGVIHRDLKPANIRIRSDGAVKVLDFGLAKLVEPEPASRSGREHAFSSPTITSPAMMTGIGVILGTAAYMSPEQARGNVADKRADIWAFGVVVFEMLTGDRLFAGETISDTLASVLKTEPNWRALPADLPPRLRGLLRWCLNKDRKRRLRDIGDARLQMEDLIAGAAEEPGVVAIAVSTPAWRGVLPWVSTGALAAGLVATLLWAVTSQKSSPAALLRMSVELGADVSLVVGVGGQDPISLSPNGTVLAFVGQTRADGNAQLYVRRLSESQATVLAGTDGAVSPFFSPDGHWIAFFADGKLKKISVSGGATVALCDAPLSRGGDWGDDGNIVFMPDRLGSLMRCSSAIPGGTPEPIGTLAKGEGTQRWPQVLPGGRAVLFTASSGDVSGYNDANLVVQRLPDGAREVVQKGGFHGRYLSSGHLVFVHDGTLFAAPFDVEQVRVTGPPVPVLEGMASQAGSGSASFAVSTSGMFAYVPGTSTDAGIPIHWMDKSGKTTALLARRIPWLNVVFSPSADRLAFQSIDGQSDIWVYDWARDGLSKLTTNPAADTNPVWTPDGRRMAFASTRDNKATPNLWWQRAEDSASPERLTVSTNVQLPGSWHPSSKSLVFEELNQVTKGDLMILPMEGDEKSGWKPAKPTVFSNGPFDERQPTFSPDGKWLAYVSNEAGRHEVYVRAFQGPGKWQISTGGGRTPTWSPTTRELYYGVPAASGGTGQIMVVPFTVEADSLHAEKPRLWSEGRYVFRGPNRMFDLHRDGTRFALAPSEEAATGNPRDHVTFLVNFSDELRRVAPVR
jgi:serine/threonine-protein kinase